MSPDYELHSSLQSTSCVVCVQAVRGKAGLEYQTQVKCECGTKSEADPDLRTHTYKHFSAFTSNCCYSRPVRSSLPMNAWPLASSRPESSPPVWQVYFHKHHLTLNCVSLQLTSFSNSIALPCVQPNQRPVLAQLLFIPPCASVCRCNS